MKIMDLTPGRMGMPAETIEPSSLMPEGKSDEVAIYVRSAVRGRGSDDELAACRQHCAATWGGNGSIFDDTGISGLNPDRPAFDALLKEAATSSIKVVVVHDVEAIARTVGLCIEFFGHLTALGVAVDVVKKVQPVSLWFNAITLGDEARRLSVARMKAGRDGAKLERGETAREKIATSKPPGTSLR
jgi:DNA invertase Pin-like site-specific DNA recombinase